MSTPPKTLRDSAKARLTDVTTGLYMISATCGLVDAVCFLALGGVFAEMMTGNLLLMALSIGTGSALGQSARYVAAIMAFSLGALIGGRLLRGPSQKLQERRIGFAVECVIIVAATALTWLAEPDAHDLAGHIVVAMLALAMGIQNAMVRVHGVPDLATNVMTVTFTGIIADSTPAGGTNRIVHGERRPRRPAVAVRHGMAAGADQHRVRPRDHPADVRREAAVSPPRCAH
jgi:uncharacterized membrane protein YoaK (UPF0700 family)